MTSLPHPALPALEAAIRQAVGSAFCATESAPVGGGSIHQAITLGDGRERYFVKLGAADALPMFESEADGLAAIAGSGSFRTPAVIARGANGEHAFLILEHLELRPLASMEDGARFAEHLMQLHRTLGAHFGWPRDNFIGLNPQLNGLRDNWARFFADCRLRPQFALAKANGFGGELQQQGERLFERVAALFLDYRPQPSLLHGDLWHGNAAMTADGEPVLFDPAVHHGDREADLAMSELFGGFPSAFYAAYRKAWPLDEDYEQRKLLYSLYHVLNHLNLFGRGYLREALRLATRLNEELSLRRD
jgi:fructosamine-3-kinase